MAVYDTLYAHVLLQDEITDNAVLLPILKIK